jgi:hypothetical protein
LINYTYTYLRNPPAPQHTRDSQYKAQPGRRITYIWEIFYTLLPDSESLHQFPSSPPLPYLSTINTPSLLLLYFPPFLSPSVSLFLLSLPFFQTHLFLSLTHIVSYIINCLFMVFLLLSPSLLSFHLSFFLYPPLSFSPSSLFPPLFLFNLVSPSPPQSND